MPTVPTQDAPTIGAQAAVAPEQVPSEAFGAQVLGEGLKEVGAAVGQGAQTLAQHALAFQDQQNQIDAAKATGEAYNGIYQAANDYRDNNLGMNAKNNLAGFYSKLEDIYNDKGANLNTAARIRYEAETRSAMRQVQGQTAVWASAQYKDAAHQIFKGKVEGAANLLTSSPESFANPENQARFQAAFQEMGDNLGTPQEELARQMKLEYTKNAVTVAENMLESGNAAGAIDFFKKTDDSQVDSGLKVKALGMLTTKAQPLMAADLGQSILQSYTHGAVAQAAFGGISAIVPPQYANVKPSSGFGQRTAPIAGASTNHMGVDYPMPVGTPLRAPVQGVVEVAGAVAGFGNAVKIKAPDGTEILMGHLSGVNVSVGDTVSAGTLLGKSGNEGVSTGPHLHLAVYQGGKAVDPQQYMAGHQPDGGPQANTVEMQAQHMPEILQLARQRAEAQFPGNTRYADMVVAKIQGDFNSNYSALNVGARDTFQSVEGVLANNPDIRDMASLAKTNPQLAAQVQNLPGNYQKTVFGMLRGNDNAQTPERLAHFQQLYGELELGKHGQNADALTPQWVAKVYSSDIPMTEKKTLVMQQEAAIAKAHDAQHQGQLQQSIFSQVTRSNVFLTSASTLGVDKNSPEYNQLMGAVSLAAQTWTVNNPNKKPQPQDIAAITSQVFSQTTTHTPAKPGGFLGFGKQDEKYTYNTVPDNWRQTIINQYTAQKGHPPNEQEIGYWYNFYSQKGKK